jgi:SAM-dependent methyltransferase
LGHFVVGLEGSARFAAMAREQGYEVWEQDFLKLQLPDNRFDGVFANASLFHVPSHELPRVLRELHATLKPGGFCSAQIHAAIMKKAGTRAATAPIITSNHGAVSCWMQDLQN